jgi:hypothetical protein
VASIQRTRKPARPISEKTRAEDARLRKHLENLSEADTKRFDQVLNNVIKPTPKRDGFGHG